MLWHSRCSPEEQSAGIATTAKDGMRRSGLSIVAGRIVPLGQIGKKRPKTPHKRGSGTSDDPVLTPDDAIPF
jgi:hypothetical protein